MKAAQLALADDLPDFVKDAQSAPLAAEYVRAILRKYPTMKADLRDLLWKIDNQQGVRIDSLPDAKLKGALRGLFTYLNLRYTKQVRRPPAMHTPTDAVCGERTTSKLRRHCCHMLDQSFA